MLSDEFNKPPGTYFLSHSVGLAPKSAPADLAAGFFAPWLAGDSDVWPNWLAAIDAFRFALAPLIGADPDDICPQTNISSALTKALFSLAVDDRRKRIVLCEDDFPTVGFVIEQFRRSGFRVDFIKSGAHLADPEGWAAAYADDVAFLHLTHVFSNSSLKTPVAEIVRRARAKGVVTIVDAAQSAGGVEVDATGWGADFITGTSLKYLCGGPGGAFLWVNPEIAARCAPVDVGWFSHENPFEFDIRRFRYAPRAARFWGGTPSIAPFLTAASGARAIGRTGVAAIAAHNEALVARLVSKLPANVFVSHTRKGEHGNSFILAPRDAANAAKALGEAAIAHDARKGGLRFSVHLYNDEIEIDRLIEAVAPYL